MTAQPRHRRIQPVHLICALSRACLRGREMPVPCTRRTLVVEPTNTVLTPVASSIVIPNTLFNLGLPGIFSEELFTKGNGGLGVHPEQLNGAASNCRCPMNKGTCASEVIRPHIASRMKQANELACVWVIPSNVRPFIPIALWTRQRQVLKNRLAFVLLGYDVVDLK